MLLWQFIISLRRKEEVLLWSDSFQCIDRVLVFRFDSNSGSTQGFWSWPRESWFITSYPFPQFLFEVDHFVRPTQFSSFQLFVTTISFDLSKEPILRFNILRDRFLVLLPSRLKSLVMITMKRSYKNKWEENFRGNKGGGLY